MDQQPKPRYGSLNVALGGPERDPHDHSRRDGRSLYGRDADGRPLDRPRVEMREFRSETVATPYAFLAAAPARPEAVVGEVLGYPVVWSGNVAT